jgi:hypothetical protein
MARESEEWGGELRPPIWLRRFALADNSPGRAHAARTGQAPRVNPDGMPLRVRFLVRRLAHLHRDRCI